MTVKVVLADDHKIMRQGLRALLDKQPDVQVVGEADNGRAAVELACQIQPDLVVMDITMPELNGIEATRQITGRDNGVKVLALSMYSDKRFVSSVLSAGASGYLLKDCAMEELIQAIHAVSAHHTYLSPGIAGAVVEDYMQHLRTTSHPTPTTLSPREREVLQLIAEGKPTKEMARTLNLSTKTVETHRQRIMRRLDMHSVAELTKYAIREGLTSLEP